MFLVEFFLGMAIGFYCIYPKFRGIINSSILRIFRHPRNDNLPQQLIWEDVTFKNITIPTLNKQVTKQPQQPSQAKQPQNTDVEWDNGRSALIVSEDKVAEWLSKNPGLKVKEG